MPMRRPVSESFADKKLLRQLLHQKSDLTPEQVKGALLLIARQMEDFSDELHYLSNRVGAVLYKQEQDELMTNELATKMMKTDRP